MLNGIVSSAVQAGIHPAFLLPLHLLNCRRSSVIAAKFAPPHTARFVRILVIRPTRGERQLLRPDRRGVAAGPDLPFTFSCKAAARLVEAAVGGWCSIFGD